MKRNDRNKEKQGSSGDFDGGRICSNREYISQLHRFYHIMATNKMIEPTKNKPKNEMK